MYLHVVEVVTRKWSLEETEIQDPFALYRLPYIPSIIVIIPVCDEQVAKSLPPVDRFDKNVRLDPKARR